MTAWLKTTSLDDFLAWEERQELRYEFDGTAARAMTGGTVAHSIIQVNLIAALRTALRGKPCRAHGSHLKIRTATSIRYPDALIVCGPTLAKSTFVSDATVVFEILSPSSAALDLGAKGVEYRTLPSLRRYVVLHQARLVAEVFTRSEFGEWLHETADADAVLDMPEVGVAVPLAEIYDGVDLLT